MTHPVILVDDHAVVRFGLRALIETTPEFRVVAEAADGVDALRVVERHKPDVLLLDLSLPGLSGLEVAREAGRLSPRTGVLVVSMHADESYAAQALHNGASGYLRKDAPAAELLEALREVAGGRRYLDSRLSQTLIDAYVRTVGNDGFNPLDLLSTRERQILQLTAEGHSATAIGRRLFISARTVETHRANVMRKLGLRTHSDVVLFAVRHGLVSIL